MKECIYIVIENELPPDSEFHEAVTKEMISDYEKHLKERLSADSVTLLASELINDKGVAEVTWRKV